MKKHTLLPALLCALYCVTILSCDKHEKPNRACSVLKIGAAAVATYTAYCAGKDSLWYACRGTADVVTGQTEPHCTIRPHVTSCRTTCDQNHNCWTIQYGKNSGGSTDNIPLHATWSAITGGVALCAINFGMNAAKNLN